MTSPINFFCQGDTQESFKVTAFLQLEKLRSRFKMPNMWQLVSKVWLTFKWDICACAEDTKGFYFNLKMFLRKFCLNLNVSSGCGILTKVLFFKNYRYKKFSPAETSKISEFRWLYSTSHKIISPKYLLVGFSHDIPHKLRLSSTPNSALYQFVSGFAKIWL